MQQVQAMPTVFTVAEVASALRVDPSTVYRAVAAGELRALRLAGKGHAIRIPAAEVERLLAGDEER